jgi:hypothetical protein
MTDSFVRVRRRVLIELRCGVQATLEAVWRPRDFGGCGGQVNLEDDSERWIGDNGASVFTPEPTPSRARVLAPGRGPQDCEVLGRHAHVLDGDVLDLLGADLAARVEGRRAPHFAQIAWPFPPSFPGTRPEAAVLPMPPDCATGDRRYPSRRRRMVRRPGASMSKSKVGSGQRPPPRPPNPATDNRSRQLNPKDPTYYSSRGTTPPSVPLPPTPPTQPKKK